MMKSFSRESLLARVQVARPEHVRLVTLPGADAVVGVRMLSAADREVWESVVEDEDDRTDRRATMLALALSTPDGQPLFTLADTPSIAKHFNGNDAAILYRVALDLNQVSKEAFEAAVGKSSATPSVTTP